MPFRFDTEEEVKSPRSKTASSARENNDTEIALGTRSLLAIFFGLVLVCGVFFGLGYSIGRAGGSRAAAQTPLGATAGSPGSHLSKPSADQTLTPVQTTPATSDSGTPAGNDAPPLQAASNAPAGPAPVTAGQNPAAAPAGQPSAAKPAAVQPAAATSTASFMVQVAAVRVPQDAQILVEALKKHGYTASVRNEPQDQLMHVQLGPYLSRSDAMAMRAKLLSDGYNAVVK